MKLFQTAASVIANNPQKTMYLGYGALSAVFFASNLKNDAHKSLTPKVAPTKTTPHPDEEAHRIALK